MLQTRIQTRLEVKEGYRQLLTSARDMGNEWEVMRELGKRDLFFLFVYILNRTDGDKDWCFARCREVQAEPDGYIDLWFRESYKSSIITFTLTIQDIINDPEETFGILSHTRPIAKSFLRVIKFEAETNIKLKTLYPDIFYEDPQKQSPKWSEDDGLIFKRKGNPKEATIEAYGLVDNQPTSKHWGKIIYDDIVTEKTVGTADAINKTTKAWEISTNLGKEGGAKRYIGTFYHFADTLHKIIEKGVAIPRVYTATNTGKRDGKPVLFSQEYYEQKLKEMGPYVSACQLFLNPVEDNAQGFKKEWLRYWQARNYNNMNLYILCDPAGEKKKENDYTCYVVVGLGCDQNYYVITWIRDRLNLVERANVLFHLHQMYRPTRTGYEKVGKDSDIQHYEYRMKRDNYRFGIEALHKSLSKADRIKKLVPLFNEGRIYIPEICVRVNYEKKQEDLTQIFVNTEYLKFPFCEHDDMLDCLADILHPDMQATFPQGQLGDVFDNVKKAETDQDYDPLNRR